MKPNKSAGRDGTPVHDAAGFVTLTPEGYRMRAVTQMGQPRDSVLEPTEDGFRWMLDLGPGGEMVYTVTLTPDSWTETGAYCAPDAECLEVIAMSLTRVDGPAD